MRNAGFLGVALIGVGYFVGSRQNHASEVYMAKSKPLRHTFSGAGQLEFEDTQVKNIDCPIIDYGSYQDREGEWREHSHQYCSLADFANITFLMLRGKGGYVQTVNKAIDSLRKVTAPEFRGGKLSDDNWELKRAWEQISYLFQTEHHRYNTHQALPSELPSKTKLFCHLRWAKEMAEMNPQIKCLMDVGGSYGRGREARVRAYSTLPPFASKEYTDIRVDMDANESSIFEYKGDSGQTIRYKNPYWKSHRLNTTAEELGWLDPTVTIGGTKPKPKNWRYRYESLLVLPPLSWWPTDEQLNEWYDEIASLFNTITVKGMKEMWDSYQRWIEHGTSDEPFPTHDERFDIYRWKGSGADKLLQFKNMDGYDKVNKQVQKNLRAHIKKQREQLKLLKT